MVDEIRLYGQGVVTVSGDWRTEPVVSQAVGGRRGGRATVDAEGPGEGSPSELEPEDAAEETLREAIDPWRQEATPTPILKGLKRYLPPPATSQFSRAGKQKQRAIRKLGDDVFAAQLGLFLAGGGTGAGGTEGLLRAFPRTTYALDLESPAARTALTKWFNQIRYWIVEEKLHPEMEPRQPQFRFIRDIQKRYPRFQTALKYSRGKAFPIGLTLMTSAMITNEARRWDYQRVFKEPAPGPSAWEVLTEVFTPGRDIHRKGREN